MPLLIHLHSPAYPVEQGSEGFETILDFIESMEQEWRPDLFLRGARKQKYSRNALRKIYAEESRQGHTAFALNCAAVPSLGLWVRLSENNEPGRLFVSLGLTPFPTTQRADPIDGHTRRLLSWVRNFASRFPVTYGLGHSSTDFYMGTNPLAEDPFAPYRVYEVYWLNVYGPRMVEELGRGRVLSTPGAVEELPGDSVLLLTRPTPDDFDSEEARWAQARALVHLRPDLTLESTLETLRQRSRAFTPVPMRFDEDVADILQRKVAFEGLANKRKWVERFNLYHPPPVSEWLPVQEVPPSDVEDVRKAIDTYEGLYAEQLIALMHAYKVDTATGEAREALASVDFTLWHRNVGAEFSADAKQALIPALGAWLGTYLVAALGGRWVPRRELDEAAILIGDRAWLPFLRARHALQGQDSPLDFSCTQFFRLAQRMLNDRGNLSG